MTIEEAMQAKQEAERRIGEVLQQLQETTGLNLGAVDVRYIECTALDARRKRLIPEVRIELHVP